jgi:hypothetical protein
VSGRPTTAEEWYELAAAHARAALVAHSIRPEDAKQRWIELAGIALAAVKWIDTSDQGGGMYTAGVGEKAVQALEALEVGKILRLLVELRQEDETLLQAVERIHRVMKQGDG